MPVAQLHSRTGLAAPATQEQWTATMHQVRDGVAIAQSCDIIPGAFLAMVLLLKTLARVAPCRRLVFVGVTGCVCWFLRCWRRNGFVSLSRHKHMCLFFFVCACVYVVLPPVVEG